MIRNFILTILAVISVTTVFTSDFSVITVGTGTPDYSESRANSSTIIQYQGDYFIVDAGDGSYANLSKDDFSYKSVKAILFTHHHIDHTTDFFDMYTRVLLAGSEGFTIIGPPRTGNFLEFYNSVFLDDVLYRISNISNRSSRLNKERLSDFTEVKEIVGEDEFNLEDITITTAEMTHSMYNLAYRFSVDGKSIVISGDTSYDEDLITLAKDADILVIDGAIYKRKEREEELVTGLEPFYEYGGNFSVSPHLKFNDMLEIAAKAGVKKLVITHFNDVEEKRIEESIRRAKEIFNGEVIYANDMMELTP